VCRHKPTVVWGLRKSEKAEAKEGGAQGYVGTVDENHLVLQYRLGKAWDFKEIVIRRRDVELIARRLRQCLEETR
jgi:hypothetical protein